jgi:large subunit ribosomal protein L31
MKQGIHPEYVETNVTCSCGNTFTTRSIKPELHVELCNQCHPFYTGKQKLVDTGGRVERFQKKYASRPRRPAQPTTDEQTEEAQETTGQETPA